MNLLCHRQKARGCAALLPIIIDKNKLEKMLPKGAVHQGLALATGNLDDIFIQDMIIKSAKTQEPHGAADAGPGDGPA